VAAAIERALARKPWGRTWVRVSARALGALALAGVLALGACAGARRRVLFERDAGRDAGAPPADAGTRPVEASVGPQDASVEPVEMDAGCAPCPIGAVSLDAGNTTELRGGEGGVAYVDLCPDDQALIGYVGSVHDIGARASPVHAVGSLQGLCGALELAVDGALRVTSRDALPERGEPDAARRLSDFEQRCPADHVVVGVDGRAGLAIDRVSFVCAHIRARASDGGSVFEHEEVAPLIASGGDGGSAFSERCPPGSLAHGHHVNAGRWIDALALSCAWPALISEPEPRP
jgi:hypothetical protein